MLEERTEFINGFESWKETFFEIVSGINRLSHKSELITELTKDMGHTGLYDLAEELTDEFEEINSERFWDGEFIEEIEKFIEDKLL